MGRYAQAAGVSVEEYVDKARSQLDAGALAPLGRTAAVSLWSC